MLGGLHRLVNSFAFNEFVIFHEPTGNAKKEVEPEALSDASEQDNKTAAAALMEKQQSGSGLFIPF